MGDIAQILAGAGATKGAGSKQKQTQPPPPPPPPNYAPTRAMKITGLSREVMDLLSGGGKDANSASLPPIMPSVKGKKIKVGNRYVYEDKPVRKWGWTPFSSSARVDGAQFYHWVREGVEFPDYPYARFNVHIDPVKYTQEQYTNFLQDKTWTKSETDKLMELARIFELRWAVIYDRWISFYEADNRKLEDLQHRYYFVASILNRIDVEQAAAAEAAALAGDESKALEYTVARAIASADHRHQPPIQKIGTGSTNKQVFDLAKERERRAHLDLIWHRSKEEEREEAELRKELRLVEAQLRKLKKGGTHVLAAGRSAASQRSGSAGASVGPQNLEATQTMLNQSFSSSAPVPTAGTPYLQSARLATPSTGGGPGSLPKAMLKRMDQILKELKVPEAPLPTKRNCDLFDAVRKSALTLLSLQKIVLRRQTDLEVKRRKWTLLTSAKRHETVQGDGSSVATQGSAASTASGSTAKTGGKANSKSGARTNTKSRKKASPADTPTSALSMPPTTAVAVGALPTDVPAKKTTTKRKKKVAESGEAESDKGAAKKRPRKT